VCGRGLEEEGNEGVRDSSILFTRLDEVHLHCDEVSGASLIALLYCGEWLYCLGSL